MIKIRNLQNNKDLLNIIIYVVIGTIIIIATILIISAGTSLAKSEMVYDPIAELELDEKNTGSISESLISVIGTEHLADVGMDADINNQSLSIIREFLTLTLPEAESCSVKKSSVNADDYSYYYTIVADGHNYDIKVHDLRDGNFKILLSDERNELFSYQSKKYLSHKKDSRALKSLLPKIFYDSDPAVSFTVRNDGVYEINVNSCGDEKVKQYAKELVDDWLTSNSFDPEEINYIIPTYCDGES